MCVCICFFMRSEFSDGNRNNPRGKKMYLMGFCFHGPFVSKPKKKHTVTQKWWERENERQTKWEQQKKTIELHYLSGDEATPIPKTSAPTTYNLHFTIRNEMKNKTHRKSTLRRQNKIYRIVSISFRFGFFFFFFYHRLFCAVVFFSDSFLSAVPICSSTNRIFSF